MKLVLEKLCLFAGSLLLFLAALLFFFTLKNPALAPKGLALSIAGVTFAVAASFSKDKGAELSA